MIPYFIIGAVAGVLTMIMISVIVISGGQSDEEYRRELEDLEGVSDESEEEAPDDIDQ